MGVPLQFAEGISLPELLLIAELWVEKCWADWPSFVGSEVMRYPSYSLGGPKSQCSSLHLSYFSCGFLWDCLLGLLVEGEGEISLHQL